MTRLPVAIAALLLLGGMVAADLAGSQPLNPWRAPPLFALGSGAPAAGAHCASLPGGG